MTKAEQRICVVTGGAAGIGSATVRRFATDGFAVAVADRDGLAAQQVADTAVADGGVAEAFTVDVGDAAAVEAFAQVVGRRFGHVDVLVNNAGIAPREGGVLDISFKLWELTLRVNLTSVFLVTKALAPLMPEGSSVVNLSSTVAFKSLPGGDAYVAAKGGVMALTRAMAVSLADRSIRVNALAPGAIVTDEVARRLKDPELGPAIAALKPPGRAFGTPDEAAAAIAFLAGRESTYVNGTVLTLDGGSLA